MEPTAVRQIVYRRRGEGAAVSRVLVGLAIFTLLGASLQRSAGEQATFLLAYQDLFETLHAPQQIACREARVAIEEICAFRADEGRWPEVEELQEEFITPFAPLFLVSSEVTYKWSVQDRGPERTYLGLAPEGCELPHLLIRVEESVEQRDPLHRTLVSADSFHQRLDDDAVAHYSVWHRSDQTREAPMQPEWAGWRQVISSRRDANRSLQWQTTGE